MAETRVYTAPLAIVKINSIAVGKMRNVRVTETIRRARVTGLGRLNASEVPPVEWTGNLTCQNYTINFNLLANKIQLGSFRNSNTVDEWANKLLLQEDGLEIVLLRKVKDGAIDPTTGAVQAKYITFAKTSGAFMTREGFDVQEGQISGRDTEFEYIDPILYNTTNMVEAGFGEIAET